MDTSGARVERLIESYRSAALAHGEATSSGDHELANRHHDTVAEIYRELRSHGRSVQMALLPLLADPADAVRAWSAAHALEFSPERGEAVLTDLAQGGGGFAFNARMTLREWQAGRLSFP